MRSNNSQRPRAAGRLAGAGTLVAVLSALALMAASLTLEAQGKGGGQGGGKPGGGGGGGGEPPPEPNPDALYTLTRIEPPAGTVSFFPYGMNKHAEVVGLTQVKASGKNDAPGPAGYWSALDGSITLPSFNGDPAAWAMAVADNGLIAGFSVGRLEFAAGLYRAHDYRPVWWFRNGSGFDVGNWLDALRPDFLEKYEFEWLQARSMSNDGRFVVFAAQHVSIARWMAVVAEILFDGSGPPEVIRYWVFDDEIQDISHDGLGTVRVIGYGRTDQSDSREAVRGTKWADSTDFVLELIPRYEGDRPLLQQVNRKGEVVGNLSVGDGSRAVFYFDLELNSEVNMEFGFLPTLGGSRSNVHSINDDSYAVGRSHADAADSTLHPFLWHPWHPEVGELMLNLNAITDTQGLELIHSHPGIRTLINNANHIVARAKEGNSTFYVLLSPVDAN